MNQKNKKNARIKILFIDHTPFVGGAQICLARDMEYIDRTKFQPILVIDKNSKFDFIYKRSLKGNLSSELSRFPYKASKVKIIRISFGRLKHIHPAVISELFNSVKQLLNIIDSEKPDLVVTNTTRALVLAGFAKDYKFSLKLFKRGRGMHHQFKLIARVWDYEYPNWLMNALKLSVDKFLFVSKSIQDFYKIQRPKGEVVYLASDIHTKGSGFRGQGLARKLKKELGIEKGDFVVGFAGRLVEWKGPLFLFNSFRKLNDPKLKLIYFGTGRGQEDDIEGKLRKEIRDKKMSDRVVLAGFMEDQTLIYKLINCFVQSSIEPEPFATNMIEAALTKVPIIATHIGGTPEFIKSGKNGLLVKPKDTNQLAQALLRLYKEKKLAKRLASNAFKDAQKFREERFIKGLEEIYRQIASKLT